MTFQDEQMDALDYCIVSYIDCSECGKRRAHWALSADQLFDEGWRVNDDEARCPDCATRR